MTPSVCRNSEGETDVVVAVDDHLVEKQLQDVPALFVGHLVQAASDLTGPGQDVLHEDALFGQHCLLRTVVVQFRSESLQPFGDELALMVELGLGDLARHVQPDGPVLLGLDPVELALRPFDLPLPAVIVLSAQRLDAATIRPGL